MLIIDHIKYGQRFEVTSIDRIMPKEVDAITDVLASDLFKGIGRKTATKIVDNFKEKTFDVITNYYDFQNNFYKSDHNRVYCCCRFFENHQASVLKFYNHKT